MFFMSKYQLYLAKNLYGSKAMQHDKFTCVHVDNNSLIIVIWLLSLPFIATVAWSKNWLSWNTTAAENKGKAIIL